MRVFLSVTSLLPAYGGPARSVSRLAQALADAEIEVGLWASNDSATTTPFLGSHTSVSRLAGDVAAAIRSFGKVDVIHDNGIWMPHNHRLAGLATEKGIPRIVSTRGMLEPWAMKHRGWKKKVAWMLYQRSDLESANAHHVTAHAEGENLQRFNFGAPVCIIPNGVDLPEVKLVLRKETPKQQKTALFLGRIHPVKGLPMLIEAWATIRPSGWRMKIAGPDEDGHRVEIENKIRETGLSEAFELVGEVEGKVKEEIFRTSDLFILPSHSENFGMAIGEALAWGLPVITTRGTPWQLLETERCGWWTTASTEGVARALAEATSLPCETLREMGMRGRQVVSDRFGWPAIASEFSRVYQWLAKGSSKPSCVAK